MTRRRISVGLAGFLLLGLNTAACEAAPSSISQRSPEEQSRTLRSSELEIARAKSAMMTSPEDALRHAQIAASFADPSSTSGLTASWLEGEALLRSRRADQALAIFDKTLQSATGLAPTSQLRGDLLKARGQANTALARVRNAINDYQEAYEIFRAGDQLRSESAVLQSIGTVYHEAGDESQALKYFTQAAEVYSGDPALSASLDNITGLVLKDMGRYDEARTHFVRALAIADKLNSDDLRAVVFTNLAQTAILSGHYAEARVIVDRGLLISRRNREAASEKPFLLGVAAQAALKSGDKPEAGRILDEVFRGVDLDRTPAGYHDMHGTAAEVYEALGKPEKALAHEKALKRIDDLTRSLTNSVSAALVQARFDFTNQDLRITRLKKAQLEKDLALGREQEQVRHFILLGLLASVSLISLAGVSGILYLRWSRNRIRAARDDLATANEHLETALAAKTRFLAMTSHELRTPLNGILGITQVLLAGGGLRDSNLERVTLVHSAGETMKDLVNDLLDVAKTENSSIELEQRPFGLRATFDGVRSFWADKAAGKELDFTVEADVPLRAIGDESRLKQLIHNLLVNAIKFTKQGKVTLQASFANDELVFRVNDTGLGIAPEDHERIFEPFTQVDSGTSRQFGGTGLGLSICRRIARAMSGDITVESRLGHGACFIVRLPLEIVTDTTAVAIESDVQAVLVLDPNPLNCGILKAALGSRLGTTLTARSLELAEREWQLSRFRLIVADIAALGSEDDLSKSLARLVSFWPSARITLLVPESFEAPVSMADNGVDVLFKPMSFPVVVEHLCNRHMSLKSDQADAA